jgi:GDP-4-dehydro-6-deoxy-D-mannose reductase
MRVLVTGSHGFVGPPLRRLLQAQGHSIIGLGRTPQPASPGEEFAVADLRDRAAAADAVRRAAPDAVVHLAGDTGRRSPAVETLRTNVLGTLHLMEGLAAAGRPCRVLVAGTSAQYGRVPEHENPIHEETELRAEGAYGWSKSAAETLALSYQGRGGLDVIATRPFNHLGPGEPPEFVASSFALQAIAIESGAASSIDVGNLDSVRDLTDVRDIVRGYAMLLERGRPGTIYNLCTGRGVRVGDLLALILDRSGVDAEVRIDPARVRSGELPLQIGSFARAERDAGWRPEIPLEKSVDDLLEHWRARRPAPSRGGLA